METRATDVLSAGVGVNTGGLQGFTRGEAGDRRSRLDELGRPGLHWVGWRERPGGVGVGGGHGLKKQR